MNCKKSLKSVHDCSSGYCEVATRTLKNPPVNFVNLSSYEFVDEEMPLILELIGNDVCAQIEEIRLVETMRLTKVSLDLIVEKFTNLKKINVRDSFSAEREKLLKEFTAKMPQCRFFEE